MKTLGWILLILFAPVLVEPGNLWAQSVTHGPVVGAVTSSSARFLLRTDTTAQIAFQLSRDSSFDAPVTTTTDTATAARDFFAMVSIDGLEAGANYTYRAVIDGAPQTQTYQFKTFPAEGAAATFTFAFGGCQQNPRDPQSNIGRVFPLIARDRPRFFLQLGDWTYPDTTDTAENPADFFNVDFSRVQDSYRAKYAPDYAMAELFGLMPIDYVYDDHDYANNNTDMTAPGRDNSLRGYAEMFPHYPLANAGNGLWHKFTFGNADFFVLDTRTQRTPNASAFQQDATGRLVYQPPPEHRILQGDAAISGELQMDWLIRELQASTADWKFVCTSVPFNPAMRAIMELALFVQGTSVENVLKQFGFDSASEAALLTADSWNGFVPSVQRLLRAVSDAQIENIIMLSADSHTAAIDDGGNALFPEIMAGGLDRTNSRIVALAELLGMKLWNGGGQGLAANNFNSHYGRITVFGRDSVRLELVDEFDKLLAAHTVYDGHIASPVALTHVVESQFFPETAVGDTSRRALLLLNTGADSVSVDSITASRAAFFVNIGRITMAPGERTAVDMLFAPQTTGPVSGSLRIASNDPDSPAVVSLQGRGVMATTVAPHESQAPENFTLAQNYPNPFNGETRIAYSLKQTAQVDLAIYNLTGQRLRRLRQGIQESGAYTITWDGRNESGMPVASGIYVCRLQVRPAAAGPAVAVSRKMILLQ